jgi:heat shock protein HtpX
MWEIIRSNRRKSVGLIILMTCTLAGLGAAIGAYLFSQQPQEGIFLGVMAAMIVWIVMLLISASSGERILLATAGAREVKHDDAPQLYNIVEEMKIASGLPAMPKVFIIDSSVPNAFAVGLKPQRAAVAVTTGLMAKLNRDELQGVIAHEIGHITNRDTLFMTLAGVTVGAVIILADLFLRGMFYSSVSGRRSSRSGGGQAQLVILVVSIIVAILAPLLAQLLYFATSRRREYLADASAARFTRYPEGLASALEKIASGQTKKFNKSRTLAPMYIVNPMAATSKSTGLFSTHPPTEDRIRVLRGMTGSSSYHAYEQAYRNLHNNQGVLSAGTLKTAQDQAIRQPTAGKHDTKKSMRDIKDILHRVEGYAVLACSCGMKMKIPKGMDQPKIDCPRCGRTHTIPPDLLAAAAITAEHLPK